MKSLTGSNSKGDYSLAISELWNFEYYLFAAPVTDFYAFFDCQQNAKHPYLFQWVKLTDLFMGLLIMLTACSHKKPSITYRRFSFFSKLNLLNLV